MGEQIGRTRILPVTRHFALNRMIHWSYWSYFFLRKIRPPGFRDSWNSRLLSPDSCPRNISSTRPVWT
jgi:hypothetical protein